MKTFKIAALAGDGIGPEVMREAIKVLRATEKKFGFQLNLTAAPVGWAGIDTAGKALPAMLDGGVDLLWLLGADELDTARIAPQTFVVYQGHHGDRGAARADIRPGAAIAAAAAMFPRHVPAAVGGGSACAADVRGRARPPRWARASVAVTWA